MLFSIAITNANSMLTVGSRQSGQYQRLNLNRTGVLRS